MSVFGFPGSAGRANNLPVMTRNLLTLRGTVRLLTPSCRCGHAAEAHNNIRSGCDCLACPCDRLHRRVRPRITVPKPRGAHPEADADLSTLVPAMRQEKETSGVLL